MARKLRILLVEDDTINQKMIAHMLQNHGYTVVLADNGRKALATFEKETFDLVLMDVQMPDMDGFEVTAAIRESEQFEVERSEAVNGKTKSSVVSPSSSGCSTCGVTARSHIPIVAMTAYTMEEDKERCLQSGMDDYISKPIKAQELFDTIENLTITSAESETSSPAEQQAGEIFDEAAALDQINDDVELLRELAEKFLEEYPQLLSQIREAISSGDSKLLEEAAHTLKGSVGILAAKTTFEMALKLEAMGRKKDLSRAEETYVLLEEELKRLKAMLETLG